ncbi:hypothetical protein A2U01_0018236, partial [Trifolium medium]|nr:hypothetical protein [Trifolium medium]
MEAKEYSISCKRHRKEPYFAAHHTKRQHHIVSKQASLSHHTIVSDSSHPLKTNQTFKSGAELLKLTRIRTHLKKINKPASLDGDLIDCVLTHQQPAFDHPKLKGHTPLDPPKRPKGYYKNGINVSERFQLWTDSDEACPEGTVPIRRTTEEDILRA